MFFRIVYKSGPIFLPFCHNARVWQTDGRTDRNLITIPRLQYMQRGKNARSTWTTYQPKSPCPSATTNYCYRLKLSGSHANEMQ